MSSGQTLVDEYQQDLKHFLREHHACPSMLGLDQEVPHTRNTDADYIKSEIKIEDESLNQPPQVLNFFVMEESINSTNNSSLTNFGLVGTSWPTPYSSSASSFCSADSKDSLNTPTPYSCNAINGLRWQPPVCNSNSTSNHSLQSSPFLSSASLPSTAASSVLSSSYSPSVSSSLSSSSTAAPLKDSPLMPEVSPSPWSTFTLEESRFVITPPPSSASSTSSSSASLSPSPQSSGSFLMELGYSTAPPASSTSFNVTNELAGSGCTIVSNGASFLSEPPQQALHEDIMEYTDLDKQPFSLYEDLDAFGMPGKQNMDNVSYNSNSNSSTQLLEDPELEQTILLMHDSLQKDSEALGIPFDPIQWTAEHVQRWVSSVCQKNKVPDVSSQLFALDGPSLCSLPASSLHQYGESGKAIALGIDFYKAASSIIPREASPATNSYHMTGNMAAMQQQQQQKYMSPCVSPTPSQGSNSQASSAGFSTHSDHSDDETGPAHPQPRQQKKGSTPHLWEFLKELLVSGDPAHADCIRWLDRKAGVFKIEDSKKVAYLWGKRKNRPLMNYDKLSRSVRQYYRKGIIKKTEQTRRLVYQFCDGYL